MTSGSCVDTQPLRHTAWADIRILRKLLHSQCTSRLGPPLQACQLFCTASTPLNMPRLSILAFVTWGKELRYLFNLELGYLLLCEIFFSPHFLPTIGIAQSLLILPQTQLFHKTYCVEIDNQAANTVYESAYTYVYLSMFKKRSESIPTKLSGVFTLERGIWLEEYVLS